MDVVNGKIVTARTERSRSDIICSALKPSRGLLFDQGDNNNNNNNRLLQPEYHHTPTAGSFNALRGFRDYYGSQSTTSPVYGPFQPGWKRTCTGTPGRDHTSQQQSSSNVVHRGELVLSNALFDEEMDMYESHVSRAVIGHIDRSVGKKAAAPTSSPPAAAAAVPDKLSHRHGGGVSNPLKRPRMEPHSGKFDQVDGPWIAPLRYLLRKVMSVSDVGELGRIVLPKKDAEGQLPQIDIKGKQLEMKDYSFSKSWFFHYKWWVNNKSRMYVLENTGEFIKYHGLKANDSFFVYEDGCGNLVAQGQKKLTWIPQLDSNVNNSNSGSTKDKDCNIERVPLFTEHQESCCVNSTTQLAAPALD